MENSGGMTSQLKVFTFVHGKYLPGGFPAPPEGRLVADVRFPDHVRQCRVIVVAHDQARAEIMLASRGLAPPPGSIVAEADGLDVDAMRTAGLLALPMAWLLFWKGAGEIVIQVSEDGNMQRVGRIAGAGTETIRFETDEPAKPVRIDPAVVEWVTSRHRNALAKSISDAIDDLKLLPTKLLYGHHITSEMNAIIGRLIDAAGRARALDVIEEITPKN